MNDPVPVVVVSDGGDPIANEAPVRWAVEQLQEALRSRGLAPRTGSSAPEAGDAPVILVAGAPSPAAQEALAATGATLPDVPEALALVPLTGTERGAGRRLLACGRDVRGLVYAVLELADRVTYAEDAATALTAVFEGQPVVERPANTIRSDMRLFTSDVEDKGWYHDREFWKRYLTMLATQRFNRFQLALGIGFDFARNMRDSYFYFPYPFLVTVPGYDVRAKGVSDEERRRNLETLRFIARETKARGLHFQLGLWAHVYVFEDSPEVNHPIEGLTAESHPAYCRNAVRLLLEEVPEIDGLTIRIHGESGIPEGSYDFWRTLLSAAAGAGRRVEIDMHAKGIDQAMIDVGLETGQPVVVSPKFWAEHLGLPYHQAEIRAVERPGEATGQHARLMALSAGSRRFTRYGYADLLPEERNFDVLFRIWPGTHRLLLWGDPATGAGYGRAFSFAGAAGVEVFEPLSFSGRRGSGLPNGRNPYADESLWPDGAHDAWEKYLYTYRLWGRLLYNPEANPETWRRYLRHEFGTAAADAEAALAPASRILPMITTAHHPSAANNSYWPEIYTNMPIVDEARPNPFRDSAPPRLFGNVSPLDPQLFSSIEEYVGELLGGERSGKVTPLDVARCLDGLASEALRHLEGAEARALEQGKTTGGAAFRRWATDVRIEAAIGRFFAAKLRAGVGYTIFRRTGDVGSLEDAVASYREARAAWQEAVEAGSVYKRDLTFGPERHLRGHWADRVEAIDGDLQDMEAALQRAKSEAGAAAVGAGKLTLRGALEQRRPESTLEHTPPGSFAPGEALPLEAAPGSGHPVASVRLYYRHVTQAERFQSVEMERYERGGATHFRAAIPASYTRSPYALQYYFEPRDVDGRAWLWPGFDRHLSNQPYFVVRSHRGT